MRVLCFMDSSWEEIWEINKEFEEEAREVKWELLTAIWVCRN